MTPSSKGCSPLVWHTLSRSYWRRSDCGSASYGWAMRLIPTPSAVSLWKAARSGEAAMRCTPPSTSSSWVSTTDHDWGTTTVNVPVSSYRRTKPGGAAVGSIVDTLGEVVATVGLTATATAAVGVVVDAAGR